MKTAFVHARMEPQTKRKAEGVLAKLGISPTEAIRIFYRQISLRGGLPFPELQALLKECRAKLDEAAEAKAKRVVSLATQYDNALLRLQRERTRKGELDKATAIQEARKTLAETDILTAARALLAETSSPPEPAPPQPPPPTVDEAAERFKVVGTWRKADTGTIFVIRADGTVLTPRAQSQKYRSGKWTLKNKQFTLIYQDEEIHLEFANDDLLVGRWSLRTQK